MVTKMQIVKLLSEDLNKGNTARNYNENADTYFSPTDLLLEFSDGSCFLQNKKIERNTTP